MKMKLLGLLCTVNLLLHVDAQCAITGCPTGCTCCQSVPTEYTIRCSNTNINTINLNFIPSPGTVTALDIASSYLQSFPQSLCTFTKVWKLSLKDNLISNVTSADISCLKQLSDLDLSYNRLTAVYDNTFSGNSMIRIINFSNNQIAKVERLAFTTTLYQLDEVYLDYNQLTYMYPWPQTIPSLTVGSFTYNNLSYIINDTAMILWSLINVQSAHVSYLNLQYNNFTSYNISLFHLVGASNVSDLMMLNMYMLDVRNNPFTCECDSYDVLVTVQKYYQQYNTAGTLATPHYYDQVTCSPPSALAGSNVATLDLNLVLCPVSAGCTSACGCGYSPYSQKTIVICSNQQGVKSLPNTVPASNSLVIRVEGGGVLTLENVPYLGNISELYVGNNKISLISSSTVNKLGGVKVLQLHGNQLSTLPRDIMLLAHLEQISIHNNPLSCDCQDDWFRSWLDEKGDSVLGADSITCSGHVAAHVKTGSWCAMKPMHYLAIAVMLIAVLFSIASIILIKASGNGSEVSPDDGDLTPRFPSARSRLLHLSRSHHT